MVFQKDYVLRMIEMLGDFAREIAETLRDADAQLRLDETCRRACGMPLTLLEKAEPETLQTFLGEAQRYFGAHLLLMEAGVRRRRADPQEQTALVAQALRTFNGLTEPDYLQPAASAAAQALHVYLSVLPEEELLNAAALLERGGEYAAAEDALYAAGPDSALMRDFYLRLLDLPEAALLRGGLTRAELLEGLEETKA